MWWRRAVLQSLPCFLSYGSTTSRTSKRQTSGRAETDVLCARGASDFEKSLSDFLKSLLEMVMDIRGRQEEEKRAATQFDRVPEGRGRRACRQKEEITQDRKYTVDRVKDLRPYLRLYLWHTASSLPPAPSVSPGGGASRFEPQRTARSAFRTTKTRCTQVQVQVQVQQVCARPSSAARWPRLRPRAACPMAWRPPSTHLPARGRSGATRPSSVAPTPLPYYYPSTVSCDL